MDPLLLATLTATITALASGAAGQAGQHAWTSVSSLIKAKFGKNSRAAIAVDDLDRAPDESHAETLLRQLIDTDPTAIDWLATRLDEAKITQYPAPLVHNSITDGAQVGQAFQAHTMNFGSWPNPPSPTPDPR